MFEKYSDIFISEDYKYYKFTSVGVKGRITKIVRYYDLDLDDYYNLGFGDQDPVTGDLDDLVISNNGDSEKVLTTVAITLFTFTSRYPKAKVYITGSTEVRTRLYRMSISRHLCSIEMDFKVEGLLDGEWQPFRKDVPYEAFLVTKI